MVSIIIINYNQKTLLKDCLDSVYEKFRFEFEVIVINNSPNENLEELKQLYRNIIILNNSNRGYSNANNLGAKNSSGSNLLFLNADTKIVTAPGDDLFKLLDNPETGAVGLKLFNEDGTFQLSFWKENNFLNEISNKNEEKEFEKRNAIAIGLKETEYSGIKEVDWVTGAALAIRKDVFLKAGGFDEKFFLFYEDADLCKRLKDAGYKNMFYPFCNIIHYKGEIVNQNFQTDTYYYSKESQLYYYRKHCGILDRVSLRFYLFVKFFILTVTGFKKLNAQILMLTMGVKRK
ncbi:MAG TPA: glycosyltransferase family 2 protein [Ignavibacteria bacterium]|nr:glycosyltransferase family 2 protein [Bacteroidota bacterium]HRI84217.1 glycosyltransferase family 2 protein [Ignavibacteria bacterium]HRJ99518.1 glycosyltransferase family 2 protein [Ignavibacteria bacterium]HRK00106.1 glycosyltransferase family 2 protein [Ignavibacteria bacterium]